MFACSWKTAGLAYTIVLAAVVGLKIGGMLSDLPDGGARIISDIITHIVRLV